MPLFHNLDVNKSFVTDYDDSHKQDETSAQV